MREGLVFEVANGELDDGVLAVLGLDHFQRVGAVEVKRGKVRLTRLAEELVFISAKSASRTVAPWLDV